MLVSMLEKVDLTVGNEILHEFSFVISQNVKCTLICHMF